MKPAELAQARGDLLAFASKDFAPPALARGPALALS
jgi:hypothetical protein